MFPYMLVRSLASCIYESGVTTRKSKCAVLGYSTNTSEPVNDRIALGISSHSGQVVVVEYLKEDETVDGSLSGPLSISRVETTAPQSCGRV